MGNKIKAVHYLSDYGPANFWVNITKRNIDVDIPFIKNNGFNTIILIIPYSTFVPEVGQFNMECVNDLDYIVGKCRDYGLKIVMRAGYLWDTTFSNDTTYNRYIEMYTAYETKTKSKYIDDFNNYLNFLNDRYPDIECIYLSWEDYFWPVSNYLFKKHKPEELNEKNRRQYHETQNPLDINYPVYFDEPTDLPVRDFIEHLLANVKNKSKLTIEQRTNGVFNKIRHDHDLEFGYYNPYCLKSKWYELIQRDFLNIQDNLVLEKQFLEWFSRVRDILKIGTKKKFILCQFNLLDNTYDDDEHHNKNIGYRIFRDRNYLGDGFNLPEKLLESMDLFKSIITSTLDGIGVWALWSTYNGNVYNGTFKYGTRGWETQGALQDEGVYLTTGQNLTTDLAYTGLNEKYKLMIRTTCTQPCTINVKIGECEKDFNIQPGACINTLDIKGSPRGTNLSFNVKQGSTTITRVEAYRMDLKSFLYTHDKKPTEILPYFQKLTEDFK